MDDTAKLLIDNGADINIDNRDVNVKDSYGRTALHYAVCKGDDTALIHFLIKQGIDVSAKDNDGWTALHIAADKGYLEIVKWLIEEGASN